MFGEESILRSSIRTIDNKGRINLPTYCHAEPTDTLVILAKQNFIEIWNARTYNLYLEYCKPNEFTYPDQATAFIVEDQASIDKNGRLNLGTQLKEEYQLQDEVAIEGRKTYIRIWNKEKFKQYKIYLENQEKAITIPKKRVKTKKNLF